MGMLFKKTILTPVQDKSKTLNL